MFVAQIIRHLWRGARPLSNAFKSVVGKEVKELTPKQLRRLSTRDSYRAAGRRTLGQHAWDKSINTAAVAGAGLFGFNKLAGKFDSVTGGIFNPDGENSPGKQMTIMAGLTAAVGAFIKMPALRPLIMMGAVALAGYALYKNALKNEFTPAANQTITTTLEHTPRKDSLSAELGKQAVDTTALPNVDTQQVQAAIGAATVADTSAPTLSPTVGD